MSASLRDLAKDKSLHDELLTAIRSMPLESLDDPDENGANVLWYCAQSGDEECVAGLLARGVRGEVVKKDDGVNACYIAAQNGHVGVLKLLVTKGAAQHDLPKKTGATALLIASQEGFLPCVQYLLSVAGTNIEAQNEMGVTPLIIACFGGHQEVAQTLLWAGANPLHNAGGSNAYEWCKKQKHTVMMSTILHLIFNKSSLHVYFWKLHRFMEEQKTAKQQKAVVVVSIPAREIKSKPTVILVASSFLGMDEVLLKTPPLKVESLRARTLPSVANMPPSARYAPVMDSQTRIGGDPRHMSAINTSALVPILNDPSPSPTASYRSSVHNPLDEEEDLVPRQTFLTNLVRQYEAEFGVVIPTPNPTPTPAQRHASTITSSPEHSLRSDLAHFSIGHGESHVLLQEARRVRRGEAVGPVPQLYGDRPQLCTPSGATSGTWRRVRRGETVVMMPSSHSTRAVIKRATKTTTTTTSDDDERATVLNCETFAQARKEKRAMKAVMAKYL